MKDWWETYKKIREELQAKCQRTIDDAKMEFDEAEFQAWQEYCDATREAK